MKVRSARGELIDMSVFLANNETVRAVGNGNMNARGDILGPKGEILEKRSDITQAYHANNPKQVVQVGLRDISNEVMMTPEQAVQQATADARRKSRKLSDSN